MKGILIISALILSITCSAQEYQCEVSTVGGMTIKTPMKIIISDSSVVFEGVTLKRKESASNIYYTDGVVTSSISIFPNEGRIKGFAYNCLVTITQNVTEPQKVLTQFCWKKN